MAKHTAKALNSTTHGTPGSKHTLEARGRHQGSAGAIPRSKKTTKARGHNPTGKSAGGGTSAATRGIYGNASPRYTKRNTRGIPNSR